MSVKPLLASRASLYPLRPVKVTPRARGTVPHPPIRRQGSPAQPRVRGER